MASGSSAIGECALERYGIGELLQRSARRLERRLRNAGPSGSAERVADAVPE
jgi:hypothetical protein